MRSASARNGAGSKPMCMGWSVGRHRKRGVCTATGSLKRSASAARASVSPGRRPTLEAMTSGRLASAIQAARRPMAAGSGCGAAGGSRGVQRRIAGRRRRQRLARQRQVHRAAGARQRRLQCPRHHQMRLVGAPQLVVPLDELAHHAGLVEHLLGPVDRPVARTEGAVLQDRRAAGHQHQRDAVAARVRQHVDGVGRAHVDVHHHRLRRTRHQIGAVRHRHGQVLVRHQHGARHLTPALPGAREAFDDGREIGAGVDEEMRDAVTMQGCQQHVAGGGQRGGGRWWLRLELPGHRSSLAWRTFPRPKQHGRARACQAAKLQGSAAMACCGPLSRGSALPVADTKR